MMRQRPRRRARTSSQRRSGKRDDDTHTAARPAPYIYILAISSRQRTPARRYEHRVICMHAPAACTRSRRGSTLRRRRSRRRPMMAQHRAGSATPRFRGLVTGKRDTSSPGVPRGPRSFRLGGAASTREASTLRRAPQPRVRGARGPAGQRQQQAPQVSAGRSPGMCGCGAVLRYACESGIPRRRTWMSQ